MGIVGLVVGMIAFIFALAVMNEVSQLRKEHEMLKEKLKESGILKNSLEPGKE